MIKDLPLALAKVTIAFKVRPRCWNRTLSPRLYILNSGIRFWFFLFAYVALITATVTYVEKVSCIPARLSMLVAENQQVVPRHLGYGMVMHP